MTNNIMLSQNMPNILIVDDVPANLKILNDILESDGYRVRPVLSGTMALQVAEKEKPDLIILDIMMPVMDGYEVCRRIKEDQNLNDVPIIFISALNETPDIVKALKAGGADYITKPFQAEEVSARVAVHLKLYQKENELQKLNFELQKLNAEKDKFFSIIAHDLRSPFHGFLGLTELLVTGSGKYTDKELVELSTTMNKLANNLFNLLKNLLEWSQIQRGTMNFEPMQFYLSDLLAVNIDTISERCIQKGITLINGIKKSVLIYADRKMINSVFLNLISNAVKFSNQESVIIIKAKQTPDNTVEISIRDTGIGISEEEASKLFKLGEKKGRKGTDGELSTGLGLLLCKEFVEKNGGRIWVESEVGKGSTFYFTVPEKECNA